MYRFSFFLISFICSIFLFISPVLADEEIEIDNDFLIEEEIETETQEEVVEEHIEDIEEEDIEEEVIEEIEEYIEDNYDDFIDDLMPIEEDYDNYLSDYIISDIPKDGDYFVFYLKSNDTYYYARLICSDPCIYIIINNFYISDGVMTLGTITNRLNIPFYNGNTFTASNYFNSTRPIYSIFNDSGYVSLDNASINVDNTQIVEKLDNVLNTFYIMVFIVCTILGFLLAYIFVKMLFKI